MSPTQNPIIPERVTQLREALGLSQADLARLSGTTQQSIDQIERGKVRRPRSLHELAKALESDPDYLIGLKDNPAAQGVVGPVSLPPGRVQFGGYVGAGGFLPADDVMDQSLIGEEVPSSVVPNPDYPELSQFAWLVKGDSMTEAGIHEGMWVVAARYMDFREKIGELYNGLAVIVQRTRFGGSEIERTIKEVEFSADGMYLVPRSSNSVHRTLFVPHDHEADSDVEEISVLAVVLSAFKVFTRRAR